jgi:L-2,4-diaminobutyric acid acetyltransferase
VSDTEIEDAAVRSASTPSRERELDQDTIRYRGAAPEDGRSLHRLVDDGGVLELNTTYSYVLMCDHFAATTVIAEHGIAANGGAPVGFVTAYRPPSRPEAVFVWQIGVHPSMRGRGVARGLLDFLVRRPACRGVRFLEATVTPNNVPSRRLFTSFARHRGASFEWSDGYPGALFGAADDHEPEHLIRIGPLVSGTSLS